MTAVEQMIDEFNEELKVAIEIGNEDKIRIIKHLITIATSYLPKEKEQSLKMPKYDLHELAEQWVFVINGHKWSINDDTAGDNFGSFKAGFLKVLELLTFKSE